MAVGAIAVRDRGTAGIREEACGHLGYREHVKDLAMATGVLPAKRRHTRASQAPEVPDEAIREVATHFWMQRGRPDGDPWRDWFRARIALRECMRQERMSVEAASRLLCQDDGIPIYTIAVRVMTETNSRGVAAPGGTQPASNGRSDISKEGNGRPMSIGETLRHWANSIFRPGGETPPLGSGQSPSERRTVKMLSNLPSIPSEAVSAIALIPSTVAFKLHVFPLNGQAPARDKFRDACGFVRLLCERPLTDEERDELCFAVPFFSFEYVHPEHREFDRFHELANRLPDLLEYYYPPEPAGIL